jgi:hypothetical protein
LKLDYKILRTNLNYNILLAFKFQILIYVNNDNIIFKKNVMTTTLQKRNDNILERFHVQIEPLKIHCRNTLSTELASQINIMHRLVRMQNNSYFKFHASTNPFWYLILSALILNHFEYQRSEGAWQHGGFTAASTIAVYCVTGALSAGPLRVTGAINTGRILLVRML